MGLFQLRSVYERKRSAVGKAPMFFETTRPSPIFQAWKSSICLLRSTNLACSKIDSTDFRSHDMAHFMHTAIKARNVQVRTCSNPDLTDFRSRDVIHFKFFELLVWGFLTESVVRLAISVTVWPRFIGDSPLYIRPLSPYVVFRLRTFPCLYLREFLS